MRARTRIGSAARRPPRWRTGRWILLALVAIAAVAGVSAWFTTPRLGGRMDPGATTPQGAHALVALLRDRGVDVVIADSVDDVERAATPESLLLIAATENIRDKALLSRLAEVPGDRLVVEPTSAGREVLTPGIRLTGGGGPDDEPDCALREADRAGATRIGAGGTYEASGDLTLMRCYGGALVRYTADGRTVTVVGTADFMTNGALLKDGNAALAMNLTGARDRLIWFAPQRIQGNPADGAEITDLIPGAFSWVVAQLCLVVVLLALWQGRRLGPLVAERLPVVVRASETVEGRARLYRSLRARDQAASALRAAALQRLTPRLGLGGTPDEPTVVAAVTRRCGGDPHQVHRALFGPPPQTDTELFALAQALDDIERQVRQP